MDKETRARKCLKCGSEAHRQKDCTVGPSNPKQGSGHGRDQSSSKTSGPVPTSQQSTMATMATTATSSTTSDTIQGSPWTLEALAQAAQQVAQGQTQESPGDTSPEKTRPAMKVLRLRVCSVNKTTTALVDSGASFSKVTPRVVGCRGGVRTVGWESSTCYAIVCRWNSAHALQGQGRRWEGG